MFHKSRQYSDLREFMDQLHELGELQRVKPEIATELEITALADACLRKAGPALLIERPTRFGEPSKHPALVNLFGTTRRVALGMGAEEPSALREIGRVLSLLKEPEPPRGLKDAWDKLPMLKQVWSMTPKMVGRAPCQTNRLEGGEVDLGQFPLQHCWPGDAAPLITWGLVVTKGPGKKRQNLGIYRQQVIAKNKTIMRWLAHRGGALDFREHARLNPGKPFPIATVLGCDPATILGAVTPVPDSLSEYQFAGLLRGSRTELTNCIGIDLQVPARAEIVLEGHLNPDPDAKQTRVNAQSLGFTDALPPGAKTGWEMAPEGPFGDHTGYYNEKDWFPVFTIDRISFRDQAVYHSTYTGKPPDEPAILGLALNEVFVPILQRQFPEISDFYLPAEGCSYRMALVSIRKQYPGHAKRVMFGLWSFLRQFMYTKFIVVVDDDIDIRQWAEVIWAITTRVDPSRDCLLVDNTPIDYLDFASPVSGLGSKMGLDATNKWPGETQREWGRPITMDASVEKKIAEVLSSLGVS